ncbi:MAG: peptide ABC transporter substrate-binding protein, partial [Anaerolineae bacterium]|nr:peptide ABC transporter substrate-binding protein [Anaerolineae bacterium]
MFGKQIVVVALLLVLCTGVLAPVSAQMDDEGNILYWQAASILNPYLSGGTKDLHASSIILEPLARYDENGGLVPTLVDEIPTEANGGIAEDLTSITWNLSEGILWSDGTPVTSADVVFTWEYCVHPDAGCNALSNFADVESVEAVNDRTVTVTFSVSKPFPYGPFVSQVSPIIQAAQFADCVGANAPNCTDQNFGPVGTGPYMVEDFRANDVITYVPNPNYREEGKPYFSRVIFKGGGDAESAARAVLETGEADYAWNLQIAPAVLNSMEAAGNGTVVVAYGTGVERLMVNQTNPDPDLGEDRSIYMGGDNAHPFLTNDSVWQALSMAIDRNVISGQLYGAAGRATCNVLAAPAIYASTANDGCLTQDIAGANALLDEAGIIDSDGDGVRELDGVPLKILYQTSTNAVRQSTQALIKQWWAEIGVETELRNIDAGVFFGG